MNTHVDRFLSLFPDRKKTPNGFEARCPAHEDRKASLSISVSEEGKILVRCQASCETGAVLRAVGLEMKDLFPPKSAPEAKTQRQKPSKSYDYRDAAGKLLFQCVRFEPKSFRQRQPNGNGGWIWNLKGVPLVPYRLPELLKAPGEPVFIVEGEKDVDNLVLMGFVGTCNPMGAGKWRPEFNGFLQGRDVFIIADKDEPGRRHAISVFKELGGVAKSVQILEMPGDSKDFSDWMRAGGDKTRFVQEVIPTAVDGKDYLPFRAVIETGKVFTPPTSFKILGYTRSFDILIWQNGHLSTIKPAMMNPVFLRLLAGNLESEDINALKRWIPEEAHRAGLVDDINRVTTGTHRLKDGRWLIVSGKRAAIIDKAGGIQFVSEPVIDGRIIEFSSENWLDWDTLEKSLGVPLSDVYDDILSYVLQWRWSDKDMPLFVTAFMMLSPFQAAMSWRPSLFVNGAQGTGKSLFFELIESVFGSLTARTDKTTAHALAQSIGNTGRIPLLDEFERYRHIGSILDLLKVGNRGGYKTSGTPGPSCISYRIEHLFWMAGVYLPAELAQDAAKRSRAVVFELNKVGNSRPPTMPGQGEGKNLAARIVAGMVGHWEDIERQSSVFIEKKDTFIAEGVTDRTVENFAMAAGLATMVGKTVGVPDWGAVDSKDDGCLVLEAILSSVTRDGEPISRLIEGVRLKQDSCAEKALEANGLRVTRRGDVSYLAVRSAVATRHLLKDTDLRGLDISGPLGRVHGAIRNHPVRFSGGLQKCVLVPMSEVLGNFGNFQVTEEPSETLINTDSLEKVTKVTEVTNTLPTFSSEEKKPEVCHQKNTPEIRPPKLPGNSGNFGNWSSESAQGAVTTGGKKLPGQGNLGVTSGNRR